MKLTEAQLTALGVLLMERNLGSAWVRGSRTRSVYRATKVLPYGDGRTIQSPANVNMIAVRALVRLGFAEAREMPGSVFSHNVEYRLTAEGREACVTKTGRVLTDADLWALADEAERGYVVDVP